MFHRVQSSTSVRIRITMLLRKLKNKDQRSMIRRRSSPGRICESHWCDQHWCCSRRISVCRDTDRDCADDHSSPVQVDANTEWGNIHLNEERTGLESNENEITEHLEHRDSSTSSELHFGNLESTWTSHCRMFHRTEIESSAHDLGSPA